MWMIFFRSFASASKYIPITNDLLRGNKIVMIKQLLSLSKYENIPFTSIGKGWLTLGGSTELQKGPGYFAGDLSGITAKKAPFWFQPFYKPGKKIAKQKDWNKKIAEIVEKAPQWDIGFLIGVPAWIQMCVEQIVERYKLNNIHELWPNLAFFVHGGVSFEPYKKGFEKMLGKPITYIETYLASEGFIAYQDRQYAKGMRLVTNEHIFLEFVPFDDINVPLDYVAQSSFGQQASIFGNDPVLVGELVDALVSQVSRVNLNSQCQRGPDTYPFTGRKASAEGTLSVKDALLEFSIEAMVAAKESPANKDLLRKVLDGDHSSFLSTDLIL